MRFTSMKEGREMDVKKEKHSQDQTVRTCNLEDRGKGEYCSLMAKNFSQSQIGLALGTVTFENW